MFMNRLIKILAIFNVASAFAFWIPLLWNILNERGLFDDIFQAIYVIGISYAVQGLLILLHPLGKWDLFSSGIIILVSSYYGIVLDWPQAACFLFPILVFYLLQLQRSKLSDNFRIMYLNIWNIVLMLFIVLLFFNKIPS